MDLHSILIGFQVAWQPENIFYVFVGVLLGTLVGVLPGIGSSTTIAILAPIALGLPASTSLMMMAGVYYGSMYGGSTTAILVNTPGEASSMMTAIDGYQMARKGRAGAALAVSAIGSFVAGTLGIVALSILAVPLSSIALRFGPPEYFALMLFGMSTIAALTGGSPARGILAALVGVGISTIGVDSQSGVPRFTMGAMSLLDGVSLTTLVVGIFALGEAFSALEQLRHGSSGIIPISGKLRLTREEARRSVWPILRGSLLGFYIGLLPGAGATISAILSYAMEKRLSKHPEEFGKGAIEGVAGPESANNASTAGAMVPLLALGIPGSGGGAVLLGVFIMYGLQPGPMMFLNQPDVAWGLINSMYLGNVMLLILNLPLVGLFVRLLYIPTGLLFPMVLCISVVSVYGINGSIVELYTMLVLGMVGYLFRKIDIPVGPLVLGFVLGAPMEQAFRQSMTLSGGSPAILVEGSISITLLTIAIIFLLLPYVVPRLRAWGRLSTDAEA